MKCALQKISVLLSHSAWGGWRCPVTRILRNLWNLLASLCGISRLLHSPFIDLWSADVSMESTTCRLGWIFEVIFAASQDLKAPWYVEESTTTTSQILYLLEMLSRYWCYVMNVSWTRAMRTWILNWLWKHFDSISMRSWSRDSSGYWMISSLKSHLNLLMSGAISQDITIHRV